MDRDRLAGPGGNGHLREKGRLLDSRVRVLDVVVVEADLADGDGARIRRELFEPGDGVGRRLVSLLGVDAGRREELQAGAAVRFRKRERAMHRRGPFPDPDGEQGGNAGLLGALKDLGEVGVIVYVTM